MLIIFSDRRGQSYKADLNKPLDISIPIASGGTGVNAFHIQPARFEPFRAGSFVGSVEQGGACNCEDLHLNAHGNGTHTECVGHISKERVSINSILKTFHGTAELVSVKARKHERDHLIYADQLEEAVKHSAEALVIRTLPNSAKKLQEKYSGANPTYLHHEAAAWIRQKGYKHLLLDLPSVDREEDEGKLLAHHEFWNYPAEPDGGGRTITELIYVPDAIADGLYLLNLQIAPLETDASPSKPVLYVLA
jgi:arylformamidase